MAAAATPPGVVDPTKPAKYPVILSDALLGKSPKEILTAIRCKSTVVVHHPHLAKTPLHRSTERLADWSTVCHCYRQS